MKKVILLVTLMAIVGCSKKGGNEVLANVAGEKITWKQIEGEMAPQLTLLDQRYKEALYNIKSTQLEKVVGERLLKKEASAQGVSIPDLLNKEAQARSKQPSNKEIEDLYTQNERILKLRFPKESKAQHIEKIKDLLARQGRAQAENTLIEDLKKKYAVMVYLEPPRVEVSADDDPVLGKSNAKVTIVEFSDFTCPYCSQAAKTLTTVLRDPEYKDKVRLVYRDSPTDRRPASFPAAMAAQCANEQGQFWPYHDKLFENQIDLNVAKLKDYAKELNLDTAKFNACLDSNKYEEEVKKDLQDGFKAGVTGTPTLFINGLMAQIPPGDEGVLALKDLLNRELKK